MWWQFIAMAWGKYITAVIAYCRHHICCCGYIYLLLTRFNRRVGFNVLGNLRQWKSKIYLESSQGSKTSRKSLRVLNSWLEMRFTLRKDHYCLTESMLTPLYDSSYSFEKENRILCGPVKWIGLQPECVTSGAWVYIIAFVCSCVCKRRACVFAVNTRVCLRTVCLQVCVSGATSASLATLYI